MRRAESEKGHVWTGGPCWLSASGSVPFAPLPSRSCRAGVALIGRGGRAGRASAYHNVGMVGSRRSRGPGDWGMCNDVVGRLSKSDRADTME